MLKLKHKIDIFRIFVYVYAFLIWPSRAVIAAVIALAVALGIYGITRVRGLGNE